MEFIKASISLEPYMPDGHNKECLSRGPGVLSTPEFFLSDLWTIFNKMAITKFLSAGFEEKCVGGGLVALRSIFELQ